MAATSFGGVFVASGKIFTANNQVKSITLTVESMWAQQLRASIEAKYGKPISTEAKQYQNGFGAKFDGSLAQWNFGDSTLTMNDKGSKEVVVRISQFISEDAKAEASKRAAERGAKDF